MTMHEDITEHMSYDRGYNKGVEDGKKIAWDLVGQAIKWYNKELSLPDDGPGFRKRYNTRVGRYEAALYLQMVIKRGEL